MTSTTEEPSERREYNQIDTLVHEFCKGFPSMGLKFVDFLNLMLEEGRSPPAKAAYYLCCTKISLARQVGSRYFVTASNASACSLLKLLVISEDVDELATSSRLCRP